MDSDPTTLSLLAVNVGNTRTSFALCRGVELDETRRPAAYDNTDEASLFAALREAAKAVQDADTAGAVVASVSDAMAEKVCAVLQKAGVQTHRIGADVPVGITHVTEGAGQDRLLNALAVSRMVSQACAVIDAGTAVTVDFVDGTGVFQGGLIAPGIAMMLNSLHEGTATLPSLDATAAIPEEPFPAATEPAMRAGVACAVRGLVRTAAEQFAASYGAYPQVIATGGDARKLFSNDPFVEHIVDYLTLRGIAIATVEALTGERVELPEGAVSQGNEASE